MIDPELMTDITRDEEGPTALFAAIAVLMATFGAGFGLGWLVAWL